MSPAVPGAAWAGSIMGKGVRWRLRFHSSRQASVIGIKATVTDNTTSGDRERIILAFVWAAASGGLLYLAVRDVPAIRFLLSIDGYASTYVLATIAIAVFAGLAVSAALFACWNHTALLANVVTYPITIFSAWALAWCLVALLGAPGMKTIGAALLPAFALLVAHRTRRVAREVRR